VIHPGKIALGQAWRRRLRFFSALFILLQFDNRSRADESGIISPDSVAGLTFRVESTNVILSWPSDPREGFVVLGRACASCPNEWVALTNHLKAAVATNRTAFVDQRGMNQPAREPGTPLDAFYRVLVVPDFWFDLNGVELSGSPKLDGSDFLPCYTGSKEAENGLFWPEIFLGVDGEMSDADESIESVNFGTLAAPDFRPVRGFWLQHDSLKNGEHTLQLRTILRLSNIIESDPLCVSNAPVRIRVYNTISFVGNDPTYNWKGMTCRAQSVWPRVGWRWDIYDSAGKLAMRKLGRTVDGNIDWFWDLRDRFGKLRGQSDADSEFSTRLAVWSFDSRPKCGTQLVNLVGQDQTRRSWWSRRLGYHFVRDRVKEEQEIQRRLNRDPDPRAKSVHARPFDATSAVVNGSRRSRLP